MLDTQPRPTIRTLVASFLFTDLVGFSKGTAADQYAAKARLSDVLRRHLAALDQDDYWIKDTGDGALIAFISNPEHALYMALALGDDYGAGLAEEASGTLRTGLHLGTVKESVDVEARRNFIGDGINAAKRIMDFALPGQITASRAFFEAIANLDAAYAALFQHVGAADDKHGRAHDLYTVSPSANVLSKLRNDFGAVPDGVASCVAAPSVKASAPEAGGGASRLKLPLLVAALVLVFAAIGITMRVREPPSETAQVPVAPVQSSPRPSSSSLKNGAGVPVPSLPDAQSPASKPAAQAPAPAPSPAQSAAGAVSPPTPSALASSPQADAARGDGGAHRAAATARATPEAKPRVTTSAPDSESKAAAASPRCSRIVEKAALGEPLTPEEKRELGSCR